MQYIGISSPKCIALLYRSPERESLQLFILMEKINEYITNRNKKAKCESHATYL